jgi:hypothetical protein
MSARPGHPYFVEFRARTAASYGHAFVFYGKLTPEGQFAWVEVAGLHPAGDTTAYMLGHVIPSLRRPMRAGAISTSNS